MPSLGRVLIGIGLAITVVGLVFLVIGRFNAPVGRLPGDITYTSRNLTVYFPIVTCLVISIVLSIVFWLLNRR